MKFKGYTLNPFQVQAARAIGSNKNVLVSAPTGSGKTLVAEFAIDRAVHKHRKVRFAKKNENLFKFIMFDCLYLILH